MVIYINTGRDAGAGIWVLSAEARGDESMSLLRYPGYRNGPDQVPVVWPGDQMAVRPVCAYSDRTRDKSVNCETA